MGAHPVGAHMRASDLRFPVPEYPCGEDLCPLNKATCLGRTGVEEIHRPGCPILADRPLAYVIDVGRRDYGENRINGGAAMAWPRRLSR